MQAVAAVGMTDSLDTKSSEIREQKAGPYRGDFGRGLRRFKQIFKQLVWSRNAPVHNLHHAAL
eukprot:11843600-Karenia_brevis.AAC.1